VAQILFACVQNAGRSQIAAAFFNQLADPAKARAVSAGTKPARKLHPEVIAVMREVGIELGHEKPRWLTPELSAHADVFVTMGCGEPCPVVPGVTRQDWEIPDPQGQTLERVRQIRDDIRNRVAEMLRSRHWERRSA
jgi:arsenate reductase